MKIAVLNDTHAGIRSSSQVFIDYQEKFYSQIFFPYLKQHDIKHILHLGDYYDHRKYVNFNALNANRKHFLEPMCDLRIVMDIIPGNHDVYYKNTNQLCSLKELLGYFTSNIHIAMEPEIANYEKLPIALIPWINAENYAATMQFLDKCDAPWVAAHLELAGFDLMKGITQSHGMNADLFSKFDKVITGHYHTKSSKGNVEYLGSQMEFTWADCNDPKYFHVIDTTDRSITPVKNPITLFEKITYDDNFDIPDVNKLDLEGKYVKIIVAAKNDPYLFDKFVDSVSNLNPHDLKISESFDQFHNSNVNIDEKFSVENTLQILDSYVESTDTDLQKDSLKSIMHGLYSEASTMDSV